MRRSKSHKKLGKGDKPHIYLAEDGFWLVCAEKWAGTSKSCKDIKRHIRAA